MPSIQEIYEKLCLWAPPETQMDFDNSGFLLGHGERAVTRVLLSLDITTPVIEEAADWGAELIVSHHPLIFHPLRSLHETGEGGRALRLAEKGIAAICMHSNLDIAQGGVNDVLIRLLGAEPLETLDASGCGRVGELDTLYTMPDFLSRCKEKLQVSGLRYYDAGKPVHRLAVMGGAGGDSLEDAWKKGCDTYVTADVKYHQFLRAQELGINLIDGDHFCTETPVMPVLRDQLAACFPSLSFFVSKRHRQTVCFV